MGSQTDSEQATGAQTGVDFSTQVAWDQIWLEGYEAARKVMKQLFQELHQAQEAQGDTRRLWKQFLQELLEKEADKGQKGVGIGKGGGLKRQEAGSGFGKSSERASGSTDNPHAPGREAREHRSETSHATAREGATNHPEVGESRKRSRSPAQEDTQEAVPMEVDQEGN
eukprot:2450893-Heterocapsa_arctica.AAC.1